jgi:hypothetical protein
MPRDFNLSDYSPIADGVADDTPALIRCFTDARRAGGGGITIPPGYYRLAGRETIPLCSGLTVMADGARFLLPDQLGDRTHLTFFGGDDLRDLTWQGGHFEGRCFDLRRPSNTYAPNASTRAIVIGTSPGGETGNLFFRGLTGFRVAGAVITVRGVVDAMRDRQAQSYAAGIDIRDCRLEDCGKFMWDYGLLWQMLVWPEDYTPAETETAWRYFRQELVRRPVRLDDGDDRVRFDNRRDAIGGNLSANNGETVCFFGDCLPRNLARGRQYFVIDSGPDHIRVGDTPDGPPIRYEGAAGPDVGLIFNLSQAYMHLFQPTGCAQGKGAIDLVACRQTCQTGNRLSALGDTHHLQYCHDNVFANNQITGSRMGAFFIAEYCKNTAVTGNTVDGTNGSRVMSVEKSSENVTITGNTFRNGGRGCWINQPRGIILSGNSFVNNTTKGERDPRRGRRSFVTGEYERFAELYFTIYEPDGRYGPAIIRDNLFVTGPECDAVIDFGPNGHDLLVEGNVFEGPVRSIRVDPRCERVHIGSNTGYKEPA